MDLFWMLIALVVCAGLLYVGSRIEPHHVSKNGRRFLGTGQWISSQGDPNGRRREVWVTVLEGGHLQVDVKRRMHHDLTQWSMEGKSEQPPPKRAVYVLRSVNAFGATERMTVQVPSNSRCVPLLDQLLSSAR